MKTFKNLKKNSMNETILPPKGSSPDFAPNIKQIESN